MSLSYSEKMNLKKKGFHVIDDEDDLGTKLIYKDGRAVAHDQKKLTAFKEVK